MNPKLKLKTGLGMTLIEVMIALGIMSVVMSLALSVVGTGVRLSRQLEQFTHSNESAREGMEMLLRDLRTAGLPGGLWVSDGAAAPIRINPIFTAAGPTGTDDLWIVVPKPNSMQSNCTSPKSGAVVTANGTGTLAVNCNGQFATTDNLVVSNFTSAALITNVTFPTGTAITYAQSGVASFSSAPEKGGYQRGDQVYVVDIIRYRILPNPVGGRPALFRQIGKINTSSFSGTDPFEVAAGAPAQMFTDVEDLQVAFGTGIAPALNFASIHNPLYVAAAVPVAARISVVGCSRLAVIDDLKAPVNLSPITVEDHVPTVAPPDGFRRSVYRRRVELSNMNPVNL